MARTRRGLSDIVYRLAPMFSRGALAFAPVAFPGRITYTGAGTVGLDDIAPVQRQFLLGDVSPPEYRHDTYDLIQPALSGRYRQGGMHNFGLMPVDTFSTYPDDPGGDPNFYGDSGVNFEG